MNANSIHIPVLSQEVISSLQLKSGGTYLDMTLGAAGHAQLILEAIKGQGQLVGIDRDPQILKHASEQLSQYSDSKIEICQGRFSQIISILNRLKISSVDGVVMDLGVSSLQLDNNQRGFSFQKEGPLDMRMDPNTKLTAEKIIDLYTEKQLADLFYQYGEETRSRRIASHIVKAREKVAIKSTLQLAQIVASAVGSHGKTHPATKVFQALRIAVNEELDELRQGLCDITSKLAPRGRLVVVSFQSLEDRLVKRYFKECQVLEVITAKPITPSQIEVKSNPRSRSAKLRCAQKKEN